MPRLAVARSLRRARPRGGAGGCDVLRRRRGTDEAHRRRLRLAGRDGAGQFPHRRLGEPADLYRPAAGDPAGAAARRAGADRRHALGAGGKHARHSRDRNSPRRGRRAAGSPSRRSRRAKRQRQGHRGAPFRDQRGRRGDRARRRRERRDAGSSPPSRTSRRPSRSPRTRRVRRAAPCSSPTSSRTTTASSARRRCSSCKTARAPTASRRVRCIDAPDFPLVLPQARTKNGVGQTTKDLTEHPWAGVDVAMILTARDEAGNEGQSAAFEFRLPERPFSKPMARALVEQRRILALDGDAQANVLTALDALTLAPERFNMEGNVYLGLRSIFWQLARAKSDDQLRDVVARMWDMAVHLEDGSVSDAEQALRAAEEALRQALERGASDEEIKKLTDQLRAALDKFLQALAEQTAQESAAARPAARSQYPPAAPAGSAQHDRQARADGALRRQGCGAPDAAGAPADAGEPADGPSRPADGWRRRRRHDVRARRARRHDPQAAAVARPHLPAGPGPAARPPAWAARPAGSARPAGPARRAGRPDGRPAREPAGVCATSSRS